MFERFTEEARQAVVQAQAVARELGHAYIGTEHLLLALLSDTGEIAAQVLGSFGVEAADVRRRVVDTVGSGGPVTTGQIPFTPPAKKTLELSLREALALGHSFIGTGHMLLGLLRVDEGLSSRILLELNVQPTDLRDELLRRLSGPEGEALRAGPTRRVVRHAVAEAGSGVGAGVGTAPGAGSFTVRPDRELRRLLMKAGGRALIDDREEFSLADLLAVVEALD